MMYMVNVMAISCVVVFLLNEAALSTGLLLPTTPTLSGFAQELGVPSNLLVIFLIMLAMSLVCYLGNNAAILIKQTPFFQKRQRRRLEELARKLVAAEQSGKFNASR